MPLCHQQEPQESKACHESEAPQWLSIVLRWRGHLFDIQIIIIIACLACARVRHRQALVILHWSSTYISLTCPSAETCVMLQS